MWCYSTECLLPNKSFQHSCTGFLLVEAILSAIVIATGLVMISRALNAQLVAIHAVERYDDVLPLIQRQFQEWETIRIATTSTAPFVEPRTGTWTASGDSATGIPWDVTATHREDVSATPEGQPLCSTIRLRAREGGEDPSDRSFILEGLWPSVWVPEQWYQ